MHGGERAGGRKRVQQKRSAEAPCDRHDDRQEDHQTGVEEDGEAEDQCGNAERERGPLLTEPTDERVGENLCAARHLKESADHDAEPDEQGHGADCVREAEGQRIGNVAHGYAGSQCRQHTNQHECHEGMQLDLHDQEQQNGDRRRGDQQQGGGAVRRLNCFH